MSIRLLADDFATFAVTALCQVSVFLAPGTALVVPYLRGLTSLLAHRPVAAGLADGQERVLRSLWRSPAALLRVLLDSVPALR